MTQAVAPAPPPGAAPARPAGAAPDGPGFAARRMSPAPVVVVSASLDEPAEDTTPAASGDRLSAGHPGPPPSAGWVPTSPCGPHCLPDADPLTPVERLRIARRLAGLLVVLLTALAVVPLLPARPRARVLVAACRAMLWTTGVRVRAHGEVTPGSLVVANHLSWIDVLALTTTAPMRMIAKREVRAWPLVGALAARGGALFLDRGSLRALPATVAATAAALRAGESVGVFPEGTTWCGAAAGPLRHAPFQAALDAAAPVQPVAIVLRGPDGVRTPEACFVGAQALADAMLRALRLRRITCEVTVLPALSPVGDRRALAAAAASAIAAVTGAPHRPRGTRPVPAPLRIAA